MIVLTGAAGFIGSVVLGYLNSKKIDDILLVDSMWYDLQYKNLIGKKYKSLFSTSDISFNQKDITAVVHIGANSSTLEKDWNNIYQYNISSTRYWNNICKENNIPFIFTSSAAIYGNGSGPLNLYAFSKLASEQEITAAVLRLFNVYGPNEYHKGRMSSTIYHWFNQLSETASLKIFENSDQYFRDFVYVEDVARVIYFLLNNYRPGIYDVGTGNPQNFEHVADIVLENYGSGTKDYIPMPDDLKLQYQTYTKTDLRSLEKIGYNVDDFTSVNTGINKYFDFLKNKKYY